GRRRLSARSPTRSSGSASAPAHFWHRRASRRSSWRCSGRAARALTLEPLMPESATATTPEETRQRVRALGKWFHNLELNGVQTAPDHFLGDYPSIKWRKFSRALPSDLQGKTVLDVGCNAGFYSFEMKRRGAARVLGIDASDEYLAQARFA